MDEAVNGAGTRRLLALDGGGLRGAFTLGVLGEMERRLGRLVGRPDAFRLADSFDFLGGTSTGAIIATGLSLGWSVDDLKERYRRFGREVFKPRVLPLRLWSKYPGGPLRKILQEEFGDRTFGSADLRTLLMIVMHNRSTDSPWPLSNAPAGMYNDGSKPTRRNLEQKLWKLIAASTAAPAFFPPMTLDLGAGEREFVDGGVTAHNNPSLQLFLTATLPEYRVGWPTGADRMLLVSVGTGSSPAVLHNLSKARRHLIYVATQTPAGLMFAASNNNDVICRSIGETRFGPWLESELGTMIGGGIPDKLFSYVRYNVQLDDKDLAEFGVTGASAEQLSKLDAKEHVDVLMELGRSYAERHMQDAHFAGFV